MKKHGILFLAAVVSAGALFLAARCITAQHGMHSTEIKYLPLGDSYTIGTGTTPDSCWPQQLRNHLAQAGINIKLIGNPARNGFTSQDLIDHELPVLEKADVNFVTILIGVNDWVQGVGRETYSKNLDYIIEAVQEKTGKNKNRVVLVTIPDFGLTPMGKNYSGGRNISQGIEEFNNIIKEKGKKYDLPVADIFPVSKNVMTDPSLVSPDGLHPGAKGYAEWEKVIYPAVKKILP